jgi:hypothetical protein
MSYILKQVYVIKRSEADLYREWARILDMCEGSGAYPPDFVRCLGDNKHVMDSEPPYFRQDPEDYEFAIARIGEDPVFAGDELLFTPCAKYSDARPYRVKVACAPSIYNGLMVEDIKGCPYGLDSLSLPTECNK